MSINGNMGHEITACPERVENALKSDYHSRGVYSNRITQTERITVWDETGQSIEQDVTFSISWDSISALLTMVRTRAGLE